MLFQITIIFFALIPGICNDLFVLEGQVFFYTFQKGDQGAGICRSLVHIHPYNVFCIHAMLDIVGGL